MKMTALALAHTCSANHLASGCAGVSAMPPSQWCASRANHCDLVACGGLSHTVPLHGSRRPLGVAVGAAMHRAAVDHACGSVGAQGSKSKGPTASTSQCGACSAAPARGANVGGGVTVAPRPEAGASHSWSWRQRREFVGERLDCGSGRLRFHLVDLKRAVDGNAVLGAKTSEHANLTFGGANRVFGCAGDE